MVVDILLIIKKYLIPLGLTSTSSKELYLALAGVVVQVFIVWLFYKFVRLFI